MTGAQTEPVNVPTCERVANRLLGIATEMFVVIVNSHEDGFSENPEVYRLMSHWYELRRIAAKFTDTRDTVLSPEARERMVAGLQVAHELAHDCDVSRGTTCPPVSTCRCLTAQTIQELTLMLAAASPASVPCA